MWNLSVNFNFLLLFECYHFQHILKQIVVKEVREKQFLEQLCFFYKKLTFGFLLFQESLDTFICFLLSL
tara:strand:+ start:9799 stop:10005 length:207 start_codon:yes stop_codon:yes gene_type:complete